jgi:hypothetical protein
MLTILIIMKHLLFSVTSIEGGCFHMTIFNTSRYNPLRFDILDKVTESSILCLTEDFDSNPGFPYW